MVIVTPRLVRLTRGPTLARHRERVNGRAARRTVVRRRGVLSERIVTYR
jgi:hypothetical protein